MRKIWTEERCKEEALKYKTRGEFRIGSPSAYSSSLKIGINDVCSHMITLKKTKEYWTKKRCQEVALIYKTRSEYSIKEKSAYSKAWKFDWLDEICSHMISLGNSYNRCIYSYEFNDNFVYVGLTFNIEKRCKQHEKKGPVFNHKKKTLLLPKFTKLTEYINISEAKIKEEEYVNSYKLNNWNLLNNIKTGALGGGRTKWTKEKCKEEAFKYTNIKEYSKNSLSYRASIRNKWLDEICMHMNRTKKVTGYWTKEKCFEESLKCNSKKEFNNNYPGGYNSSIKNGWLDEICIHMNIKDIKPKGYWTKERCKEQSIKYNCKSEFQRESISAYQISINNNWLDEICTHMQIYRKPKWTKQLCIEESFKYITKGEFRKKSPSAYERSRKEGWLNELY
jgi:predicted GIY-YIG superfamily endonuclease